MKDSSTVNTTNDAARVLYGEPEMVQLSSGSTVVVKKVTLRTLPQLVVYLQSVMDSLLVLDEQGEAARTINMRNPTEVLHLIAQHLEPTYEIVLSLTSLEQEQLLDMPLDDVLLVAQRLWEVNVDFFTRKIAPLLNKAADEVSG